MGGGARALVRQPKTAVFLQKSLKPGGSKSVDVPNVMHEMFFHFFPSSTQFNYCM